MDGKHEKRTVVSLCSGDDTRRIQRGLLVPQRQRLDVGATDGKHRNCLSVCGFLL